jgi:predicted O-methyltransferase YrrM
MSISRYISVVQRRGFVVDDSQAIILPLIEPLFQIDTHMSYEERIELFRLAWESPQGFVAAEIGSYLGASTAFMAAAATIRNGHVHAIDTWRNDAMPDAPGEDTFVRFQENTRLFKHMITAHRGRADAMSQRIPALDLLFIDGDHSFEGTKSDLSHYAHKVKPGGLLIMHDFNYDTVRRAAGEQLPIDSMKNVSRIQSLQAFRIELQPAAAG